MRARLSILFLVVFVALDVVLVTLSMRHTGIAPPAAGSSAQTAEAPTPTASPTTATTKQSPSSARAETFGKGPAYVAVGADGTVLRSTRGDCGASEDPAVSVSTDRGTAFRDRQVDGLSEVLAAQVASAGTLTLVGLDGDCRVGSWSSGDAGRSWEEVSDAPAAWYLAPSPTQRAVLTPEGRRRPPCVPVSLSTLGTDVVRLLCDDGQVLGTSDDGSSWVTLGRLDGAVSIRFTTPGDGVALAIRQQGCPAAVMETSDGGNQWTQQTCLKGDTPLAIGAAGDLGVAQVGERAVVSTDGGTTWPGANG
ncbi:hypothetical protein BH10ACT10_BH10ACT10_01650 [soil metagenome]